MTAHHMGNGSNLTRHDGRWP